MFTSQIKPANQPSSPKAEANGNEAKPKQVEGQDPLSDPNN